MNREAREERQERRVGGGVVCPPACYITIPFRRSLPLRWRNTGRALSSAEDRACKVLPRLKRRLVGRGSALQARLPVCPGTRSANSARLSERYCDMAHQSDGPRLALPDLATAPAYPRALPTYQAVAVALSCYWAW